MQYTGRQLELEDSWDFAERVKGGVGKVGESWGAAQTFGVLKSGFSGGTSAVLLLGIGRAESVVLVLVLVVSSVMCVRVRVCV